MTLILMEILYLFIQSLYQYLEQQKFSSKSITYSPNQNYFGPDSLTYTITDGLAYSTATVSITVISVNDIPIATDDNIITEEDTPVYIDPLNNDVDTESGSKLSITAISNPSHGVALLLNSTTILYTPNADFFGLDQFNYRMTDGTKLCNWSNIY